MRLRLLLPRAAGPAWFRVGRRLEESGDRHTERVRQVRQGVDREVHAALDPRDVLEREVDALPKLGLRPASLPPELGDPPSNPVHDAFRLELSHPRKVAKWALSKHKDIVLVSYFEVIREEPRMKNRHATRALPTQFQPLSPALAAGIVLCVHAVGCSKSAAEAPDASAAVTSASAAPSVDWDAVATRALPLYDGLRKERNQAEAQRMFRDACEPRSQLGCAGLGVTYIAGVDGTGKDATKAGQLLGKACEAKVARACSALARMYLGGVGVEKNGLKGIELARTACDGGEPRGCVTYARALLAGANSVPKDYKQGLELSKAACEKGLAEGCEVEADVYLDGLGVPRDGKIAQGLYAKACDAEQASACTSIAVQLLFGKGVPTDPKLAVEHATRACDLESQKGCAVLAGALVDGIGVKQDASRARELAETSCSHDEADGCALAGWIARRAGKSGDAANYFKHACNLGNAAACKQ